MTPQERDMIAGLFDRLREFESQQRDRDAEALIRERIASQPAAPYLLTQTVLVQEEALKAAQARIAELEGQGNAKPAGGGFLGSAPSPWGAAKPSSRVPQTAAPAGAPSAQQAAAPQGGSFLRTAMATAAGVAGGALLFEGLRHMFTGNQQTPWGQQQANAQQPFLGPNDNTELSGNDGASSDYDLTSDSGFDNSGGFDDSSDI